MTSRVWIMLFALAFIWSGTFFLTEILLREMTPFQIVFYRVSIAAVVMALWLTIIGKRLPHDIKSWARLSVMGLLNNAIPFSAITFGQQYISGGLASILNSMTAFFGVVLSGLILKDENITMPKVFGVVLGVFGVSVVMGIENLARLSLTSIGQLLILVASISYAFAGIWGRLSVNNLGVEVSATGMLITSSIWMFLLASIFEGQPIAMLSVQSNIAIVVYAVICTAIAYLLYFRILAKAGSGNLMLVTIIIPPFALILDALALGQWVTTQQIAGFIVIALGLLVIAGRISGNKIR